MLLFVYGILPRPKKVSTGHFLPTLWAGRSLRIPSPTNAHRKEKAVPFGTTFSFLGWVMGFEPTNTGTTIRGLRPLGDTHHNLK